MSSRHWHLIAYDVCDPDRLRKTAKLLEGYGNRVQYSLFRCRLTAESLEKLRWELSQVLQPEDSLLVIPLCDRCSAKIGDHSTTDCGDWNGPPPGFDVL